MKDWSVIAASGGRYPAADPVFFNDRQRVALATALAIKIYQLSTKQMIAKIAMDCTDAIQLFLTPEESLFFLVHRNGAVDRVGVTENEATVLSTPSATRVRRLVAYHGDLRFTAIVSNAKGLLEVGDLTLSADTDALPSFESWFESGVHADTGLAAVAPQGHHIAFMNPKSSNVEIFHVASRQRRTVQGPNISAALSLAVSESGLVAIGNMSGVIDVVYPGGGIRALKWHMSPVEALQFTLNDEYLLSGGDERVLVFWQLTTNKQQFLPRLDGSINSICTNRNGTLYGLTLSDSQLLVLSAVDLVSRLHVAGTKASFVKLPPDQQSARRKRRKRAELDMWANSDYTTQIAVHPGTRSAYLASDAAQIQAYSLVRDEQETVFTVAPTLDTGKVRGETSIVDPKVALFKFSPNGKWMLTIDVTVPPPGILSSQEREINLKFWKRVDSNGEVRWELATRVVAPHGQATIGDAVFDDDMAVTAALDGSIRQWRLNADNEWSLRRMTPPFGNDSSSISIAWSADKSILAFSHESIVYLFEPQMLTVVRQLPNIAGSEVRALAFAGQNLAIMSKTRLSMYDLVNDLERWSIVLKVPNHGGRLLADDPERGLVALAVNYWTSNYRVYSRILLFSPETPIPEESYVHQHAAGGLTLIPGTSSFCLVDVRGVLNTLAGPVTSGSVSTTVASQPEAFKETLVSLYSARAESSAEPEMNLDGAAKASLDVNSFSKVFEGNATLDQLFERVLTLVSN